MTNETLKSELAAPRLLACVHDPDSAKTVRDLAAAQRWRHADIIEGGIGAAQNALQQQAAPSLLIVDIDDAAQPAQALAALIELCPPETSIVAVGRHEDLDLYRDILELGIADYLMKPISLPVLQRALRRGKRGAPGEEARKAQIITLMGARGGVGTTTIAAGLAWCLAHLHERQVALVDLDLHFGNLALNLDLLPGPGLREALEYPARIDARLIATALLHESPKLSLLAAEEPLIDEPEAADGAVETLMSVLRGESDIIIVDLPRHLDKLVRTTLAAANMTCVVTDLSLAAARDTLRIGEFNRALAPAARHLVIGNQVGAPHRGEVGRAEFERVVGLALDVAIPFEPQSALATSSTGTALPAALKSSKASAEIRALAQQIAGAEVPGKAAALAKKLLPGLPRWLKRSA